MRLVRFRPGASAVAACLGFCLTLPAFAQNVPRADPPMPLASHKAIYDLKLADSSGSKAPASASGRIAFEFDASCEGYAQTLRQALDIEQSEGERQITETRSSTFEDADGADFRFNISGATGKAGEIDGQAERGARGVAIALSQPRPFRLETGHDVLFPTQHVARIIAAARRGERIFLARVYDASDDGRKIFNVTTVIGAERHGPDPDAGAQIAELRALKRWPVAAAYFSSDKRDGLPDYVLSFDLYENGVSSGLKLDYGDFALTGELKRIEFPPTAKCRR
jgi:hypothetical protein